MNHSFPTVLSEGESFQSFLTLTESYCGFLMLCKIYTQDEVEVPVTSWVPNREGRRGEEGERKREEGRRRKMEERRRGEVCKQTTLHVARVCVTIHVRNSLLANTHGKVASSLGPSSVLLLHNVGSLCNRQAGKRP